MEKKIIEKRIFHTGRNAHSHPRYRWGEVKQLLLDNKIELLDDDILEIGLTEGYEFSDHGREDYFDINVFRKREETDEEFETRKKKKELSDKYDKERRKELYLKLKTEFELGADISWWKSLNAAEQIEFRDKYFCRKNMIDLTHDNVNYMYRAENL